MELLAGALNLETGLDLVRTLTLSGQVLLDSQVDHVIVGLDTKDLFRQFHRPACLLSFYI
jgi:hypothetical protein